ncbi:acyl carrier protein [Corynebacterium kozikiae]|uniref:acyl carrier protein n=1 Tax=Corynebacterium kozikiae TaxID=2968469 RepID=UPI002795972B|nr:acyl carrier protein [Corynebacterium sp. 76QC2CO]
MASLQEQLAALTQHQHQQASQQAKEQTGREDVASGEGGGRKAEAETSVRLRALLPEEVSMGVPLEEAGLDSLERIELAVRVQQEFQIRISEEEFLGLRSLDELCELIDRRGEGQ